MWIRGIIGLWLVLFLWDIFWVIKSENVWLFGCVVEFWEVVV